MSQRTAGLYHLTQISALYGAFQNLLAGERARRRLAEEFLQPQRGDRVLDIGCGSGSVLPYLGEVTYTGIDPNPSHIEAASAQYGDHARFVTCSFEALESWPGEAFDLAICIGVFHHVDDRALESLCRIASDRLVPGGRLVAVDPAFVPGQAWIARTLARRDSGQCVREPEGYHAIAARVFPQVETRVCHDLLRVPYTHCILTARKPLHDI